MVTGLGTTMSDADRLLRLESLKGSVFPVKVQGYRK
jgi:hypothetical protein